MRHYKTKIKLEKYFRRKLDWYMEKNAIMSSIYKKTKLLDA